MKVCGGAGEGETIIIIAYRGGRRSNSKLS